jgi:hypothetical protein
MGRDQIFDCNKLRPKLANVEGGIALQDRINDIPGRFMGICEVN